MLKTLAHLLPDSPMWSLAVDRPLKRLFAGLADFLTVSRETLDSAFLEYWAEHTTDPIEHLVQQGFNLSDIEHLGTERARTLLLAVKKRSRGMDPGSLQDILHAAGFTTIFVHEWWASSGPWVERDPTLYMVRPIVGRTRCGMTSARCGVPSARCNNDLLTEPNYLVNQTLREIPPPWPAEDEHRGIFYLCGEVFGEPVEISGDERRLLEFLILRFKRASLWAVLLVEFTTGFATEEGDSLITEDEDAIVSE